MLLLLTWRHTREPSLRLKNGSARDDSNTATGSQKADCTAELRSAWTGQRPVPTRTRPHTHPSPHETVPTRTRPHTNPAPPQRGPTRNRPSPPQQQGDALGH